jgi:FKBP-type peptidyl-prolyl cis-trans isomerase FklB
MKYVTLVLLGIGLAIGSSIAQGQAQAPKPKEEPELKTVEEKFAYAYGLNLGRMIKRQGVVLNPDILAKGIKDGIDGKPGFSDKELQEIKMAFEKILEEKQATMAGAIAEKNLKDGQEFLTANKSKPGVTTLPSGVQYKVLKSGTGKTPKLSDTLIDGTEFDASAKHGSGPSEFPVNRVIKGWTEVLQLMKVGDKWQVFIPADKAYGSEPRGEIITPNSTLVFEMELVGIVGEK